jgi:hypothetical protein
VLAVRRLVEEVVPCHPGVVFVMLRLSAVERSPVCGESTAADLGQFLPDKNGTVLKVLVGVHCELSTGHMHGVDVRGLSRRAWWFPLSQCHSMFCPDSSVYRISLVDARPASRGRMKVYDGVDPMFGALSLHEPPARTEYGGSSLTLSITRSRCFSPEALKTRGFRSSSKCR